jgi:glycosyltransferase involved in cell wall biosynthesis
MQPTVSIGMPVWNGEAFLSQAIDSILAQDYNDFELVILDNLSTDQTSMICLKYAKLDKRVKYIRDECQRDVIQAWNKISELVQGQYFLGICDDDWHEPTYISTLLNLLKKDPAVGLAYSNCGYITPDGLKVSEKKSPFLFTATTSRLNNFVQYLFRRNPIPISFGIFKTTVFCQALKYFYRPDHRGWDHDNLFILRLLSLCRVDSIRDELFYYRQRDRVDLYKSRGQYRDIRNGFSKILSDLHHQLLVKRVILKIIGDANFSKLSKYFLRYCNFLALFYFCGLKIPFVQLKRVIVGLRDR